MASIQIDIPGTFYTAMEELVQRAEQAVRSAQITLETTQKFTGETGKVYTALSEELDQVQEQITHMRERLHTLGNAINGKLGAYEAEIIIRQIVDERLKHHKLI